MWIRLRCVEEHIVLNVESIEINGSQRVFPIFLVLILLIVLWVNWSSRSYKLLNQVIFNIIRYELLHFSSFSVNINYLSLSPAHWIWSNRPFLLIKLHASTSVFYRYTTWPGSHLLMCDKLSIGLIALPWLLHAWGGRDQCLKCAIISGSLFFIRCIN